MLSGIYLIPFLGVLFIGLLTFIFLPYLKGGQKITAVQLMLLGIELTLVGGILAIKEIFGGLEYIFLLLGMVATILGFTKQNNEK